MKKRKRATSPQVLNAYILLVLILATALSGCAGNGGIPPVITIEGVDLILGEDSPSTVMAQLENSRLETPGGGIILGKIDKKSWLTSFLTLKGEGGSYGYAYLYNPSNEDKYPAFCTLYSFSFSMPSEASYWAEGTLINGNDFANMDSAQVKEAMGEIKLHKEMDYGTLIYKDGQYTYTFRFNDVTGLTKEIKMEMSIPKNYK